MINTLIFLTGCINPDGMAFTTLQDPEIRKNQYIHTIQFYLKQTSLPILFIENSGTDISELFKTEIELNKIEILTFQGNQFDKSLGKGYGEMLIIEHALEKSRFMKTADFVYKITGRYRVLNIKTFLKEFENGNHADIVIDLKKQLTFADSRFYLCKTSFYKDVFLKYKSVINDSTGVWFENALSKATLEAILSDYSFSLLKYKPNYNGITGTANIVLNDIWLVWYFKNVRHLLRYYLSRTM